MRRNGLSAQALTEKKRRRGKEEGGGEGTAHPKRRVETLPTQTLPPVIALPECLLDDLEKSRRDVVIQFREFISISKPVSQPRC